MSIFYIADTHFGHANCIKHDSRPFETVDQMENVMVRNWNSVVRPKDHVYILGDFAWKNTDEWARLLKRLNGKKVLIRGNHDPKELPQEVLNLLQGVYDYHIVHDNGRKVILSHYPILLYWHSHREDTFMLCGHVHRSKENDFLQKWKMELQSEATDETQSHANNRGQIFNVGAMMEYMNYTPRTLDAIVSGEKEYMKGESQ